MLDRIREKINGFLSGYAPLQRHESKAEPAKATPTGQLPLEEKRRPPKTSRAQPASGIKTPHSDPGRTPLSGSSAKNQGLGPGFRSAFTTTMARQQLAAVGSFQDVPALFHLRYDLKYKQIDTPEDACAFVCVLTPDQDDFRRSLTKFAERASDAAKLNALIFTVGLKGIRQALNKLRVDPDEDYVLHVFPWTLNPSPDWAATEKAKCLTDISEFYFKDLLLFKWSFPDDQKLFKKGVPLPTPVRSSERETPARQSRLPPTSKESKRPAPAASARLQGRRLSNPSHGATGTGPSLEIIVKP